MKMERVKGIEPSSSAWEAAALPLSYTRLRGCRANSPGAGLASIAFAYLRGEHFQHAGKRLPRRVGFVHQGKAAR